MENVNPSTSKNGVTKNYFQLINTLPDDSIVVVVAPGSVANINIEVLKVIDHNSKGPIGYWIQEYAAGQNNRPLKLQIKLSFDANNNILSSRPIMHCDFSLVTSSYPVLLKTTVETNTKMIENKMANEIYTILLLTNIAIDAQTNIKLKPTYNKDTMPYTKDNVPLNISVQVYVNDMVPVHTSNMHYSMDIFYRQYWRDSRLELRKLGAPKNQTEAILFSEKFYDVIWTPDAFFPLVKKAKIHKVTKPHRLFLVQPDGLVFYSQRITMDVYCQMDLYNFPFDRQKCKFNIESYGYDKKFINLMWNYNANGPVYPPKNLDMLEFTLENTTHGENTVIFIDKEFTELVIHFEFARNYGYYILQMYLPCILVVILSWVGFWIDYRSTPARVSLGITTVLTMVTLGNSIRTTVPQVNYTKSLDIYVIVCLCYVFAALAEYAIIGVFDNKWKKLFKKEKITRSKFANFFQVNLTRKRNALSKGSPDSFNQSVNNAGYEADQEHDSSPEVTSFQNHIPSQDEIAKLQETYNKAARNRKLKNVVQKKKKIQRKLIEKQRHNQETHLIDRVMRKIFPLTFFLFNGLYFYFHR